MEVFDSVVGLLSLFALFATAWYGYLVHKSQERIEARNQPFARVSVSHNRAADGVEFISGRVDVGKPFKDLWEVKKVSCRWPWQRHIAPLRTGKDSDVFGNAAVLAPNDWQRTVYPSPFWGASFGIADDVGSRLELRVEMALKADANISRRVIVRANIDA